MSSTGEDALTGEPLHAYGTPVYNDRRYYSSDSYFKVEWFRDDRVAAETAHAKASEKLAEFARAARETRLLPEVRTRTDEAQRQAVVFWGHRDLASELSSELSAWYYRQRPATVDELEEWIRETESLTRRAQAAVEATEARRAETERQRLLEEAAQVEPEDESPMMRAFRLAQERRC